MGRQWPRRPLLAAADGVVAAGDEVLIASDPRIERERVVSAVPVTVLDHAADWDAIRTQATRLAPRERVAASVDFFMRQSEAVTPALVHVIAGYQPDVI